MSREFRNAIVRFTLSGIFILLLYTLIVTFREKAIEMLKDLPQRFRDMVGEDFLKRLEEDPSFYTISQWNWKNLAQILPIVSIVMGFPMVARERENGTVYFLLSNMKRSSFLFQKYFAGATMVSILAFFSTILPILSGIDPEVLLLYSVHAILSSLLWYSISFFLSCYFKDQVKPLILSLGIFATLAVLEGMRLCHLNVLNYLADRRIYLGGGIDVTTSVRYALATLVLLIGSAYRVKSMEI